MSFLNSETTGRYLLSTFMRRGVLPNSDKLLARYGRNYEIYREMKNDAHVWSCMQSRKSGTTALEFLIEPNGAESSNIELIEEIFSNLDIYKIENDILDSLFYGFQPFEIIWKNERINNKELYIPFKIIPRPQELFSFNEQGDLLIKGKLNELNTVPPFKFLGAVHDPGLNNPFGEPILNKCFWYVTFKNGTTRFWINYTEKFGSPLLLGQFQRGASQEEVKQLAELLADMSQDAVIVTPADFKIDIAEANRSQTSDLFGDMIKYCNNEISKAILSQTLTTEIETGSYAAANIHFKIRKELIRNDSRLVCSIFNELIRYIYRVNNLNGKMPVFRHVINESENVERIDRDLKMVQAGIKLSKDYWQRTYGLKESDFENN